MYHGPFGCLVVLQPGPKLVQHLLAGQAAGADQEDMAEALRDGIPEHAAEARRGVR